MTVDSSDRNRVMCDRFPPLPRKKFVNSKLQLVDAISQFLLAVIESNGVILRGEEEETESHVRRNVKVIEGMADAIADYVDYRINEHLNQRN